MEIIKLLYFLPALSALIYLVVPNRRLGAYTLFITLFILWLLAILFFEQGSLVALEFAPWLEHSIFIADIVLLLFFLQRGFKFKQSAILIVASVQMLLYLLIELYMLPQSYSVALIADGLSAWMFLIINIVGSTIVVYAHFYIDGESMSYFKKRLFVAYLLIFISVMNLLVSSNNMLLFFFLFEMTTLASYLLIGFREDKIAKENAQKALWINLIGGVGILLAIITTISTKQTIYFDEMLLSKEPIWMLPIAFFALAAIVKGASMPFDSWLLGAMVAPTPVSAMLHSATMVKIAPFLILKISPALEESAIGILITIFGAMVFVVASYYALSKKLFKEILGYSTIAMLGLMVALASTGDSELYHVVLILMLFHAISKALLFLSAGVLERSLGIKELEEMTMVMQKAPVVVAFIIVGFFAMTTPPFGVLMGKIMAVEELGELIRIEPYYLISFLLISVGTTLLVLLYFKTISVLLPYNRDFKEAAHLSLGVVFPLFLLTALLLVSTAVLSMAQASAEFLAIFIPLILILFFGWFFKKIERSFDYTKSYHCGEKESFDWGIYYFYLSSKKVEMLQRIFALFLGLIVATGGLM